MHFDTAVSRHDETNHFMNLENDEELRLRKLMNESILKVEKENLETIQKGLNNSKEPNEKVIHPSNNSKKIPKNLSGPSSASLKTRAALFRRMKQQSSLPEVQASSSNESSKINSGNVCKNAQPKCQLSSIHFLNHFHSSFLSSKTQRNLHPHEMKDKYTVCAVPLAPPCQKKEIVDLEQDLDPHKTSVCIPNNIAYHTVSEDVPKKLTIQALPSISIIGKNPYNNGNIRLEEIREKNYSTGDCIKTTVLPYVSEEVRKRISSINLSSTLVNKISASENMSDQASLPHPKKSVFTQSSQDDRSLQIQPDKDLLKEIIKEVLQEFQHESPQVFLKLSTDQNFKEHQNGQKITSPENDCELDSFIGNADSFPNDAATMVSSNIFMKSSCTQTTDCDLQPAAPNEIDMKNLIHEVVREIQQNSSLKFNQNADQPNNAFEIEKVHRLIQVDLKHDEINQGAMHASFMTDKPAVTSDSVKANKISNVYDSYTEDGFKVVSSPVNVKSSEIPFSYEESANVLDNDAGASEMPSKLESALNFIYNRFCRETGELSLGTERILSNPLPVRTREVSIQFNPISTSNKSTATSEVDLIDASNQCDVLLPQQIGDKDIKHASVQVMPEQETVLPASNQEKVDSSVQCEKPFSTLKDACVQTVELPNASENSTNTSVSSTPVSDSMFLDDMLSEGEVFLPWNLRLLSHADRATISSSNNATEASDKEKDYSLSEGEVPPKYLQQVGLAQSPSYDSSSEAYTDPPIYPKNASTSTQKSYFIISPETESHPILSHEKRCLCRASSSSLSEGEIKESSTSLSEGEVLCGFLRQRRTFQPTFTVQDSGHISSFPLCESVTMYRNVLDSHNPSESSQSQENFGHSILDLSEGEVIGGRPQTPYQSTPFTSFLDTVNEEK